MTAPSNPMEAFEKAAGPLREYGRDVIETPRAVSSGNDLRKSIDAAMATDAPTTEKPRNG